MHTRCMISISPGFTLCILVQCDCVCHVCLCVIVCGVCIGFDIRVVLCTSVPSLIVRNTNPTLVYKFLMPEAICCCIQTCKCGFDIRVVLCTCVPSLTVRNANTTKL